MLNAYGAVSHASECQAADETSLLQGRSVVRRHNEQAAGATAVLKSLRDVAQTLIEGSDTTMSNDEVNDALEQANGALAALSPVIREQVETAQQQIMHASSAVQACHAQAGVNARAHVLEQVEQHAAALETCQEELAAAAAEEEEACTRAEDCLCDEARVRHTDKVALCAAMTETYEAVYCEYNTLCQEFHSCHATEMEVYNALRGDVEAELETIRLEYITVEQSRCITALIMEAMTPPMTPISHAALIACDDVDVSVIAVNMPELPSQPAACPQGEVQCAGTMCAPGSLASVFDPNMVHWHQSHSESTFSSSGSVLSFDPCTRSGRSECRNDIPVITADIVLPCTVAVISGSFQQQSTGGNRADDCNGGRVHDSWNPAITNHDGYVMFGTPDQVIYGGCEHGVNFRTEVTNVPRTELVTATNTIRFQAAQSARNERFDVDVSGLQINLQD